MSDRDSIAEGIGAREGDGSRILAVCVRACSAGSSRSPIGRLVIGDVDRCCSHSSMLPRSYKKPSSAITGSSGSSFFIGHRKPSARRRQVQLHGGGVTGRATQQAAIA